jgi:hypothetical protein
MKKTSLCVLALIAGSALANSQEKPRLKYVDPVHPCRKLRTGNEVSVVKHELTTVMDVPETFVWNAVNGTNYLTNIKNQHIP